MSARSIGTALIAVSMLAGCDRVFGLDRPDGPPIDQAPDSPAVATVSDIVLGRPDVAIGESVSVMTIVRGPADATFPFVWEASAGSIDVQPGEVTLDAGGEATLSATYTAPGLVGSTTMTVTAGGGMAQEVLPILDLVELGFPSSLALTEPWSANTLYAVPIISGEVGTVRALGIQSNASGRVRLALYNSSRMLIAQAGPLPLEMMRTVAPTMFVPFPEDDYWLAVVFEAATAVDRSNNSLNTTPLIVVPSQMFGSSFPTVLPGTPMSLQRVFGLFVRIAVVPAGG